MEALVMHQTALKGGDFTEVLLAGVKARNATTDRLFKSAYNNAQYENLKARTDALNNPKAAATKQVTGDDGLKYTLGADVADKFSLKPNISSLPVVPIKELISVCVGLVEALVF